MADSRRRGELDHLSHHASDGVQVERSSKRHREKCLLGLFGRTARLSGDNARLSRARVATALWRRSVPNAECSISSRRENRTGND
jgi:hypothetical protein